MEEILLGTCIGVILGTISGIIPGVHANTLAGVLLSFQAVLLSFFGPVALAGAMFAALITHTFVDAIPSTFLGIPDADTSLAVLPAHALCLEGNGEEAVRIAALGSACAMVIAVPLSLICFYLLPALQPFFDWWIGIILVAAVGYMIVTSECPRWCLALFLASGILGVFALHYSFLSWHTLVGVVRFSCHFTGLFGFQFC
jgi:putative membrane protein